MMVAVKLPGGGRIRDVPAEKKLVWKIGKIEEKNVYPSNYQNDIHIAGCIQIHI